VTNHARQVIQALIEVGSIAPDRVAAGLRVIGFSQREHVWIVRTADGPSFVVKQASDPAGQRRLAREAAVYEQLRGIERCHGPFLPGLKRHDADRGLLILDYVDGKSLAEISATADHNATAPATGLGRTLAHIHQAGIDLRDPGLFVASPPWVLNIHRPTLDWYARSSEASLRMRAIIQQDPALGDALDKLRAEWTASALIHADLKLEHVIVSRKSGRRLGLAIVDWEMAQLGDPAWDIGTIFAGYLLRWLRSIPLGAGLIPGEMVDLASVPIQRVQQFANAFWQAYAREATLDAMARRQLLQRSTRSAAAILLQREEEYLQSSTAPTSRTNMILQVSHNLLARPTDGTHVLLGLDSAPGTMP
jgi:aminoglycoside phosphotransferase (APT) family kinase protein